MRIINAIIFLTINISCSLENSLENIKPEKFTNCNFIEEKINYFDLYEGFLTLTLNHAYVPDFNQYDSLNNDYFYLKFQNEEIKGTYVITDANVRYKVNKVEPYDSISKNEYPFSVDITNNGACVYLDLLQSEGCDCD